MKKIPRMRVVYYDDERADDVVLVGQWEVNLAERKFGVGAMQAGNIDAITYAAFLGARRAGLAAEGTGYDAWASRVASTEEAGEGESEAPPA